MKRTPFVFALILVSALPALAQSTEFGVIVGGSRRFVEHGPVRPDNQPDPFLESNFSFGNNSFELYWAMPIDTDSRLRLKLGRIETEVPLAERIGEENFRVDVEGEVQHAEAVVDYRFDELWGSTGLFGGVGLYRLAGPGFDAQTSFGFTAGVNADFPITHRYGAIVEASYHWTQAEFRPRYLTLGAGLRVAF